MSSKGWVVIIDWTSNERQVKPIATTAQLKEYLDREVFCTRHIGCRLPISVTVEREK